MSRRDTADQRTPLLQDQPRRESDLPGLHRYPQPAPPASLQQRSILPTTSSAAVAVAESDAGSNEEDIPYDAASSAGQYTAYRSNALPAQSGGLEARCALIIQVCGVLFVVAVWALVLTSMPMPLPLFGYHPMIQSFAFLLLLQSILTLQTTSSDRPREKSAGFRVHRLLNLFLVLPLFTIGASIMWYLHNQPGQEHFISWHGILGTTCIAWTWLQVAVGIVVTAFDGKLVGGNTRAKSVYKWHRLSGYFLLPLFLITLYLGSAQTSWSQQNGNTYFFAAAVGLLVMIASGLTLRIQGKKLPQAG